ncbi:MAG: hypothetical protein J4F28_07255 [Nitrosopumilaceae archaeon]|nr:hypothetical protein [Nitrosopumilaceae archaeon]
MAPAYGTAGADARPWPLRRGVSERHRITCEELRRMVCDENLADEDIASKLGLGKSTIQRRRAECGLERSRSTPTRKMLNTRKDIPDIHELYVVQELNEYEISKMRNIDFRTVRQIIRRRGIPLRKVQRHDAIKVSKEALYRLHIEEKKSVEEIAEICECSEAGITSHLKKHGIKQRPKRGDPFEGITPETLESEYRTMGVRRMQKKYRIGRDKVNQKLDEYGIQRSRRTTTDRSEEATARRADWKRRGKEAWEQMCGILGTTCHVCGRPAEKKLTLSIHHVWYEHGDVPYNGEGLEKGEYHARLLDAVLANPARFCMMCQGCHDLAGNLTEITKHDAGSKKRLERIIEKMDRKKSPPHQ